MVSSRQKGSWLVMDWQETLRRRAWQDGFWDFRTEISVIQLNYQLQAQQITWNYAKCNNIFLLYFYNLALECNGKGKKGSWKTDCFPSPVRLFETDPVTLNNGQKNGFTKFFKTVPGKQGARKWSCLCHFNCLSYQTWQFTIQSWLCFFMEQFFSPLKKDTEQTWCQSLWLSFSDVQGLPLNDKYRKESWMSQQAA